MAGFLYYIPGKTADQVTPQLCATLGLYDAFRDVMTDWRPRKNVVVTNVTRGPSETANNGTSGTILYPVALNGSRPRTAGYNPHQQRWQRAGNVYIGIDTERPPTPDDLKRPRLTSGYDRELADGQIWHCPVIRQPGEFPDNCNLSMTLGVDADGNFQQHVVAEQHWAWAISGEIWDVCFDKKKSPSTARVFEICVMVLSLNYRLGPHEASMLQILRTEDVHAVWGSAINRPLIEEFIEQYRTEAGDAVEKKSGDSRPTSVNSSLGEKAPTPNTDQPALAST